MTPNEDLPPAPSETLRLGWLGHLSRVALIVVLAGLLLGWLASHTEIFFADGLRYISQAQGIERGPDSTVLKKAVDHPIYPLTIALVHRWVGGIGPQDWQFAAQLASALAGLALILPLYLMSRELFGDKVALPACLLFLFAVPLNGHVFADTLSESTFLLFWLLGLWAALCFFRTGRLVWLPLLVVASGLAYLTRPEGLLLPAATLATLGLSPRWVYHGLGKRGVVVLGVLTLGGSSLVGPYMVLKGGLGTKPSVARLLGKAPQSAAQAVERPGHRARSVHRDGVKAGRVYGGGNGTTFTKIAALNVVQYPPGSTSGAAAPAPNAQTAAGNCRQG